MGCDLLVKWICVWDGGGQALVFFLVKNLRAITYKFFSMCHTINYFTCIYTTILIVYSVLLSRCLNFCAKVSKEGIASIPQDSMCIRTGRGNCYSYFYLDCTYLEKTHFMTLVFRCKQQLQLFCSFVHYNKL